MRSAPLARLHHGRMAGWIRRKRGKHKQIPYKHARKSTATEARQAHLGPCLCDCSLRVGIAVFVHVFDQAEQSFACARIEVGSNKMLSVCGRRACTWPSRILLQCKATCQGPSCPRARIACLAGSSPNPTICTCVRASMHVHLQAVYHSQKLRVCISAMARRIRKGTDVETDCRFHPHTRPFLPLFAPSFNPSISLAVSLQLPRCLSRRDKYYFAE
jgi:hypothetical protein